MKLAVLVFFLLGTTLAAPPIRVEHRSHGEREFIPILSLEQEVEHDGKFHYKFESGDGTKVEQHGELKVFDEEHAGEVVHGRFAYVGDNGELIETTFVADENGYQPQGAHLPKPPEIPPAIARALAYIEATRGSERQQRKHKDYDEVDEYKRVKDEKKLQKLKTRKDS